MKRFPVTVRATMPVSSFGYFLRLKQFTYPLYFKRNGLRNRNLYPRPVTILMARGCPLGRAVLRIRYKGEPWEEFQFH